jgi:hypothetical protein
MLFFAGHRAGVTSDTAMLIDEKSITHFVPFESENSIVANKNLFLDSREKREESNCWCDFHASLGGKIGVRKNVYSYPDLLSMAAKQTNLLHQGKQIKPLGCALS